MSQQTNEIYEFGSFRLDQQERLLQRDGVTISLTPKAFDLLLALLERAGKLVEKEELFQTVWPDTMVEESNLSSNIALIRKALGDDAAAPRFVETVPKRGYRFIAELRIVEAEVVPVIASKEPESLPARSAALPAWLRHPNKRMLLALGLVVALVLLAIAGGRYFGRTPVLKEKDTILLADFENRTDDAIFDGTLKQGLAIQLQQSLWLNLFPEPRVQQTLREMNRPPGTRVTAEVAREICERHSIKALITGLIAPLGSHYAITLEAINGHSGESLARAQVEADSREQVLGALSQATTRLREGLGESLSSIQRFDKPLEQATTSKLEAFKAWSLGIAHSHGGRIMEAIPFYQRAVELDPDFAQAWSVLSTVHWTTGRPELAAEDAAKGYALKERVGEYEKLRITNFYHGFATGDFNKRLEVLTLLKQLYPREATGFTDLTLMYNHFGQYEQAVAEGREAIRVNPRFAPSYVHLARALVRLNRFAEARELLAQASQQNLDNPFFHALLYEMGFISNDAVEMQRQLAWTKGKLDEYKAFDWHAGTAAFGGQWRQAQEFARRAIELSARGDTKEVAAQYATEQALRGAALGDCRQAKASAAQGLQFARSRVSLPRAALAFALCGEANQAQAILAELRQHYPEDTLINELWLPVIRAALELQHGNTAQAMEQLQAATRYEAAAEFWPQYLRGQAYLKLGQGAAAAGEFQKILDHRGEAPLSVLYPLARLGLARAAKLKGEAVQAREAYVAFFTLWQEADQDLPLWKEASQENVPIK